MKIAAKSHIGLFIIHYSFITSHFAFTDRDIAALPTATSRFATVPGVEWHNNRAERQLRPLVIARKMSFGSDTQKGARRTCVLHSVAETCRLQGIRPVDLFKEGLAKGRPDDAPLSCQLTALLRC